MIEPSWTAVVLYVIAGTAGLLLLTRALSPMWKDVMVEANPYHEELKRKQKLRLKAHPMAQPETSGFDWLEEVWR